MTGMDRKRTFREPRWWRLVGALGMVLGAAFWIALVVVAWHFIGKYW